ncbi:hypothetical protein [Roseicyclus amphidinii]|uniref:hypothetical protein n=1 Tax=Roseicyclus amphidinii TaxID=3034232 RepID=UPI0024E1864B|nr:hypothetical protein [Roseicyclus sp. Amp-Y-6]
MTIRTSTAPRRARRGDIEGRSFTRVGDPSPLADAIKLARHAQASGGRERPDGEFVADKRASQIAGVNASINLRAMLPDLLDGDGRVYQTPAATPAQETRTLREAVMRNSRCVQFGAKLVEIVEGEARAFGAAVPAMVEHPAAFHVIEPADFAPVTLTEDAAANAVNGGAGTRDEGDVSATTVPISTAELDRSGLTQRAVRFTVPRSTLRARNDVQIEAEIMLSLALGLGRAVDAVLLTAIIASKPAQDLANPFIDEAATLGLRFDEIAAIAGPAAFGDVVIDNGRLYLRGVPAELSPDAARGVVGAWDRAAVAIQPEIDVLVERDRAGALTFTAWADFAPLIPSTAFFWHYAA